MTRIGRRLPSATAIALVPAALVLALVASGCGGGDTSADTTPPPTIDAESTTTTTEAPIVDPPTTGVGGIDSPSPEGTAAETSADAPGRPECGAPGPVSVDGAVAEDGLIEISGLGVSRRHPGVLWAHNDSGSAPALSAIGPGGTDLGTFPLAGVAGVDIEDLAIVDSTIHLADIGDNEATRQSVLVYRFAEPDPFATPDGTPIEGVETIELRYRTGARDAEAFLVDPVDGTWLVIEKAFAFGGGGGGFLGPTAARVAAVAAPTAGGGTAELVDVGSVSLDELTERATGVAGADGLASELGITGVATGADVSVDGSTIALRTYETIWLFTRAAGASLVDALGTEPCEAPTAPETQGEAVAIDPATGDLVTISEGSRPAINRVGRPG